MHIHNIVLFICVLLTIHLMWSLAKHDLEAMYISCTLSAMANLTTATTKHKHCFLLAASSSTLEKVSTATKLPVARSHIHMS